MLEVERLKFSSFWKTEIMTGIVARIEENLKRFRGNVQHKKCSLSCLVWTWKFLESLAKYKNEKMLEYFSLDRFHLESMIEHVMHTFHMNTERK